MIRAVALPLVALSLVAAACSSGGDAGDTAAADTAAPTIGAAPGDTGTAPAAGSNGLLDPDSATREQLAALPGMTPALADSLIAKRPFANMLAVDSVLRTSLSEAQRDTIYTRMFKRLDLNTATAAEIELIPRVGSRMRHEFEEYRPYNDIARFRREIGKYVDSTEVARLEQYVRVP